MIIISNLDVNRVDIIFVRLSYQNKRKIRFYTQEGATTHFILSLGIKTNNILEAQIQLDNLSVDPCFSNTYYIIFFCLLILMILSQIIYFVGCGYL